MSIVRYDPWQMLHQLQREMNTLFEHPLFRHRESGDEEASSVAASDWVPAVDIKEEENRFLVVADISGVDPKDIEVRMDNGKLTIKGERHSEHEEKKEGYKCIERSCGTFFRCFDLPETADSEGISAESHNGSLEVVIPKREALTKTRRIEVKH